MSNSETLSDFFLRRFGDILDKEDFSPLLEGGYPDFLLYFWKKVGFGRRQDGFIWLINPDDFAWLSLLIGHKGLIPFARNSFDSIYLLSPSGSCFQFYAPDKQLDKISIDFETTIMTLSRKSATDDDIIHKRHLELWNELGEINKGECYCLTPAIPLGGDYETSEVYIGEIETYFRILSEL